MLTTLKYRLVYWLLITYIFINPFHFAKALAIIPQNESNTKGERRISFAVKEKTINDVLKIIQEKADMHPFKTSLTGEYLNEKITWKVDHKKVKDILRELLEPRGYTVLIDDNAFVISSKPIIQGRRAMGDNSIILPAITGKVTDAGRAPVIGATVTVAGVDKRTITDTAGDFKLYNVQKGETLAISSIGYETREILVKGKTILAHLNLAVNELNETVVIAYGTTNKRSNTGNVVSIRAKDIEKQPVSNLLLAIQGRVPGVMIEQSTGLPGTGVKVRIQGANSLKQGNAPLYVVDGVPYPSYMLFTLSDIQGGAGGNAPEIANAPAGAGSPLAFINPWDIESIEVLKDAAATSIYGSRAANGAVLITTKKDITVGTKVNFNIQRGYQSVSRKLKLLNTEQYLALRREAYTNDGQPIPGASSQFSPYNVDLIWYDPYRNTDWQRTLIGNTAVYTSTNTSVSAGNASTSFLLNTGYHGETTVFPGDLSDQKGSLHWFLQHASSKQRLKLTFSGNYMLDDNRLIDEDLTKTALTLAPNAPVLYNKDGSLNWEPLPDGTASWQNPLASLARRYRNRTNNLIVNTTFSYQLLAGFDIRSSFGYTSLRSDETLTLPLSAYLPQERASHANAAKESGNTIRTWIMEPQLNYRKKAGTGELDLLIGATFQETAARRTLTETWGYDDERLLGSSDVAAHIKASNGSSIYRYAAVFGRVNYNYANRYIATLSGRHDGSSRFGASSRFHRFWSVAGAWIFTEEDWLKQRVPFINFGKIKASYGTTGNDRIGEYQYLELYSPVNSPFTFQGITGLEPVRHPNPGLQWEETKKLSIGLDLFFLKNRIALGADYYHNLSSRQLLALALPAVTGFQSIAGNLEDAVVRNAGWEFNLHTINIKKGKLAWDMRFTLTIPRNKLLSFPGLEASLYVHDYVVGQSTNTRLVYPFAGVDPATGVYQVYNREGNIMPVGNAGTQEDRQKSIDLNPRYYGGWQHSFTYRAFELDIAFQFINQMGADYRLGEQPGLFNATSNIGNQPVYVLDRWQKPGDTAPIQQVSSDPSSAASFAYLQALSSSALYSDASYIRLSNVSLSWALPENWQGKAHLKNARIFFQGRNLLTFTRYKGLDPETHSTVALPPLRVFTFGFQGSI